MDIKIQKLNNKKLDVFSLAYLKTRLTFDSTVNHQITEVYSAGMGKCIYLRNLIFQHVFPTAQLHLKIRTLLSSRTLWLYSLKALHQRPNVRPAQLRHGYSSPAVILYVLCYV